MDLYLNEYGGTTANVKVASGVAAGNHVVVVTALFEKNDASLGYYFHFDYVWPLAPQDVPDPQKQYTDVSLAIDFDTDHGFKKPPAWHLWHLQKLGFKGHADVYMGVFWNNKRRRADATYPYATIEYRLADGVAAPLAGDQVTIDVSGSSMQHTILDGESLQDIVNGMRVLINQFSGVWADDNYGSSTTLRIQSKAPSWTFPGIWVDDGKATLGGYGNEPFAFTAGVNDALLFTFGGDGGQQVNVTLTAGAARTGAEVAGDIQAAFTAAGAPATAESVSSGQMWIVSPLDIAVEGSACATLGLDAVRTASSVQATLTDHLGDAGMEGDWELIDSVSPVMTEGARKWIRDLASQFAAAGILASFAFSMEVYNPPAAMRAKYLHYAGGVVTPGQDVFLEVPSYQMHFGTRVRNYLKQMYKECADEIAAAGLPVVLQFGETQWWYFDNRAHDAQGGMPFYDQETISAFAAAKGHQIWPFTSNTDDPAGDPAHPNETADFLRDRIWTYCQEVISYVRATIRRRCSSASGLSTRTRGSRRPSLYRSLLMHVNLPEQWKTSSYGIKYFRCEGFDYDVWQKNVSLMGQTMSLRRADAGSARSGVHVPRGPVRASGPADGAGLRPVVDRALLLDVLLGVRSVLPQQQADPAGGVGAVSATAAVYHKPRVARAMAIAKCGRGDRTGTGALNRFKLNERKLNGY